MTDHAVHTAAGAPAGTTSRWRLVAVGTIGVSMMVISGTGVLAGLNATASNSPAQGVDAGTLKLELSGSSPSAGFSSAINRMAPGDQVNRYVLLANTGTLAGRNLTMKIAATGTPSLITDGTTTRALKVGVYSCSVPWTQATGTCSGTATTELTPTTLGSLSTAAALSTSTLAADTGQLYLRVAVALPDQDETTVNGTLPAQTVQGGAVNLTYTFTEDQRAATTTNS